MANETVKHIAIDLFNRQYTVASATSIDKGTFLQLSSPNTATANTTSHAACAGIALMDKDGTDFSTTITAWTKGDFTVSASGAGIVAGVPLVLAIDNHVALADTIASGAQSSGAQIIGIALSDATAGDTFRMRLDV